MLSSQHIFSMAKWMGYLQAFEQWAGKPSRHCTMALFGGCGWEDLSETHLSLAGLFWNHRRTIPIEPHSSWMMSKKVNRKQRARRDSHLRTSAIWRPSSNNLPYARPPPSRDSGMPAGIGTDRNDRAWQDPADHHNSGGQGNQNTRSTAFTENGDGK